MKLVFTLTHVPSGIVDTMFSKVPVAYGSFAAVGKEKAQEIDSANTVGKLARMKYPRFSF
jgi:hypothetical protein